MPKEMKVQFEFEIGEIVYFKTARNNQHCKPAKFQVVGRLVEECPGGIQLHYMVADGAPAVRTLEQTLTRVPPPYEPMTNAQIADQLNQREAVARHDWDLQDERYGPLKGSDS